MPRVPILTDFSHLIGPEDLAQTQGRIVCKSNVKAQSTLMGRRIILIVGRERKIGFRLWAVRIIEVHYLLINHGVERRSDLQWEVVPEAQAL